jgi:hypothetical protein
VGRAATVESIGFTKVFRIEKFKFMGILREHAKEFVVSILNRFRNSFATPETLFQSIVTSATKKDIWQIDAISFTSSLIKRRSLKNISTPFSKFKDVNLIRSIFSSLQKIELKSLFSNPFKLALKLSKSLRDTNRIRIR